jgi:glutaredoxin 3
MNHQKKNCFQQFKKINFNFLTIEIEDRPDCQDIQDVLGEMTGAKSVPRVFIDGNFVGGGTDVKKLYETGNLQKMLA